MKIKLLKPYQLLSAGEVIDPPNTIAVALVSRGIAEKIVADKKVQTVQKKKVQ
jgi:hypothetical protein